MKMHRKALTVLLLVPVLAVLTTTPAYAIFGSILAGIQRAQMIVNQGVQIYKDTMAKITLDGQLTQMTDQFAHLKEQALGSVGALTDPFTDLTSAPAEFIGVGLSWKRRLYRRGGGACVIVSRTDGRIRQELHPVVALAPERRRHGHRERHPRPVRGTIARSLGRRRPAATSRSGRKATSAWCSVTP